MTQSSTTQTIFAKFMQKDILAEQGRLLFSLLNAFAATGCAVRLHSNLPADLGKYGQMACSLKGLTLTDEIPVSSADAIYLFDQEDKTVGRRPWRKKVQVKFDVFSPYWITEPILMPYPVHPVHAGHDLPERLQKYRPSERKVRIFFSGDREGYTRNRIHYPNEKLPRLEVINAILQGMGQNLVTVSEAETLDRLLTGDYTNKFVLVDQSFRTSDQDWLGTLARVDFFLCPPGYVMPMCHNAVEAMSVGAIPIINYPEWFNPSLTHLENCIAFDDKNDLIDKLESVLKMDEAQIAGMRDRVISYYETHLTAESFTRKIESHPGRKVVTLMITDANVARNASKLNRHSILMRGTSGTDGGGWLNSLRTLLGRPALPAP